MYLSQSDGRNNNEVVVYMSRTPPRAQLHPAPSGRAAQLSYKSTLK